jgi:hypothetical protein
MTSVKIGCLLHRALPVRVLTGSLAALMASLLSAGRAEAQTLVWANNFSGIQASALEEVEGVVADNSGNVFVTGLSGTKGIGSVIRTMKLDANGTIKWNVTHNRPSLCGGMWGRTPLALDTDGGLIVVGAEFTLGMDNWNPLLLKLSPDGGLTYNRLFDLGLYASFDAVAVDSSGIYILAHNNPNNGNPHVVHTLKLNPDGTILWSGSYTPPTFWGTGGGIAVTGSGIYTAAGGKLTARGLNGPILWEKDMVMANGGSALAADATGAIYVALQNAIVKFDPNGNEVAMVDGLSSRISDLDVDAAGNLYVAGSTLATSSRGSDIITQKYNPAGKLVWSTTYGKNGGYSDEGIAITARGAYLYVGGSKYNKNLDMCTLKYTAGN